MSEVWDSQSVKISLVCKYTLLKMWSCLVVLAVKENNRRIILTFESLWTFKRTKTIGYTFASKTTKTRKGAKRINSSISGAHTQKKISADGTRGPGVAFDVTTTSTPAAAATDQQQLVPFLFRSHFDIAVLDFLFILSISRCSKKTSSLLGRADFWIDKNWNLFIFERILIFFCS